MNAKRLILTFALAGLITGTAVSYAVPMATAKPQNNWSLGKCYDRQPTLSRRTNSTHACVVHLQTLLQYGGFSPGPVDGIFGPKTEAAVKRFQRQFRLSDDGIVGPKTWTKLLNKIGFMD